MTPPINPIQERLTHDIRRANSALPEDVSDYLAKFLYHEGYRPMTCVVVTTAEELERYPVGTVILLTGEPLPRYRVWQRVTNTSYCWSAVGVDGRYTSEAVIDHVPEGGAAHLVVVP